MNKRKTISTGALMVLAPFIAVVMTPRLLGQAPDNQSPSAQSPSQPAMPQWQIDAGGKMAFDVASIKPNKGRPPQVRPRSNFPLDAGEAFPANGGLLSATDWPLSIYMQFAYKLTDYQYDALLTQVPLLRGMWYDIEARAESNPTKDQMRLMMQTLLADRFKLAVHWETRQLPIFALVLSKPGKTGPQLKPHAADGPCSVGPTPPPPDHW